MKKRLGLSPGKGLLLTLLIGGLFLALILTTGSNLESASEQLPVTFNTSNDLFVQSKRATRVPPPLRIVEDSVLQGNRTPSLARPQTLGAVTSQEESSEIRKYTVESGDTVTSIAQQFGLETETVLWANDLGPNTPIQPGDELVILPVDGVLYSVRKRDTIGIISETYGVKAERIVDYNELASESTIYVGDPLIIPGGEQPATVPAAERTSVGENYFGYPSQGVITQGRHGPLNNAVDIANNCGSPVVAAAGGTVKRAGSAGLIGNRVTVEHPNGVITLYGHLSSITVVPGQRVSQGTILGYVGHTGFTLGATGCHVHYTVKGAHNPLGYYSVGSTISW